MNFLKLYAVSIVVFLAIDAVWLGFVARDFYRQEIGDLLRPDPRWGAAAAFYALFVAGIVTFVTMPALERASLGRALLLGAFFGLVTYATYDLTNLAVLRGFTVKVTDIDHIWGATISASVAGAGCWAGTRMGLG